jgi:hypothetical protein
MTDEDDGSNSEVEDSSSEESSQRNGCFADVTILLDCQKQLLNNFIAPFCLGGGGRWGVVERFCTMAFSNALYLTYKYTILK